MPPVRTKRLSAPSSKRVIADLRELAARTSTERGAQRVAWGPVWREARAWFVEKVKTELGLPVETDPAGNAWVTLPGASNLLGTAPDLQPIITAAHGTSISTT